MRDFTTSPREGWRSFALHLFGCRDEPHSINGIQMDGKLRESSVMVFNHHDVSNTYVTEDTVREIHASVGRRAGGRVFIIAPAMAFQFQQDYVEFGGTNYYALRIPYSIVHEVHRRKFAAIRQPTNEKAINQTVDAVGFDFIRTPELKYSVGATRGKDDVSESAFIQITTFKSEALVSNGAEQGENLKTFSMLMLDYGHDGKIFQLDDVFYASALKKDGWTARFPKNRIRGQIMAIFLDIYGNEAREVIESSRFGKPAGQKAAKKTGRKKA